MDKFRLLTGKATAGAGGLVLLYSVTLFFSAFLMFLVQPMFAKMALPRLGGSSAVWSLALVFFQAVLLIGYGYAHLMVRRLSMRWAILIHLSVCALALVCLPVSIAAGWDEPPEQGLAAWLLGLFGVSVGLPFLALSANAPLLQAWFARAGQARSADPYFLYAASNAGSLIALLAYPFAFEPFIGLAPQGQLWGIGFVALMVLLAVCGFGALRAPDAAVQTPGQVQARPADWADRLWWVVLAMFPSGLLVAATAFITTDLVSAPLLWVLPLAIYLLTFIIAFQAHPLVPHASVMKWVGPLGTALAIFTLPLLSQISLLSVHLMLCFLLMLACHGELARRRPPAERLTEFYFLVSVGGVLGGVFSSLVAPNVFNSVVEYPVLIIASMVALGLSRDGRKALTPALWAGLAGSAALVALGYAFVSLAGWAKTAVTLLWLLLALWWLLLGRRQPLQMGLLLTGIVISAFTVTGSPGVLMRERSFYGVLTVSSLRDGMFHNLTHGTTVHGWQRLKLADGTPVTGRPEPLAYYYARGPFGSAIQRLRDARAPKGGKLEDVALVGLGIGATLCFSEPGERWQVYELDPQVAAVASDPRFFTVLRDCGPPAGITIGDGRLKLAHAPDGQYDMIVLDAFSSDSVPVHLLTADALALYMQKLKPGGIAVFHLTNRLLDLTTAVAGAARRLGLEAWKSTSDKTYWAPDDEHGDVLPLVVVVARDPGSVPGFDADPGWTRLDEASPGDAWTDDYSNIVGAIWRKLTAPAAGKP